MADFVLSCEAAVDLPASLLQKYHIPFIGLHYTLGTEEHEDDLFKAMSPSEFYGGMSSGLMTRTSAINPSEYIDFFEPILASGSDLLHIAMSSGLSTTCRNAFLAAEELSKRFPERTIRVLDSLSASSGYGLLTVKAAEFRTAGHSITETFAYAESLRHRVNHIFFSSDLSFYVRGGRISPAAGLFAKALNICPLCDMDDRGFLVVREKIRTLKKVKNEMVERMISLVEKQLEYADLCFISQSNCEKDAEDVVKLIESRFAALAGKILVNPVGPAIGAHTGPGTVALFFIGATRQPSLQS